MFDIEYKGANAVVFTTKNVKIAFDPNVVLFGLKSFVNRDYIVFATEDRFVVDKSTVRLSFDGPGEYEIGDISVKGISSLRHIDHQDSNEKSTIYKLSIGDVKIAIIGNIAPKLSDSQLEDLGVVDIVILPVGGGGYTLDAVSAADIVKCVEPKAVIPIHYADDAVKYEVPQDSASLFVEKIGANVIEAGSKWKVKGGASLPEQLSVVKITRS